MTKAKSLILLIVGVSIIFLFVYVVGTGSVKAILSQTDPSFFAAAVACQVAAISLWALWWKILLNPFHSVRLKTSLKGVLIGTFFNNITPVARAGGEPFRAYFLGKKEDIAFEDVFATVAIDRVLETIPFLVIIIGSLAYFVFLIEISFGMIVILVLAFIFDVILLSFVLYFSFSLEATKRLLFYLLRVISRFSRRLETYESRIEEAVEQYHTAIRTLSSQKRTLFISLAICSTSWFLLMVRAYAVVLALGYEVDFMVVVVVQALGTLVGILPLLPGGLGSSDGALMLLYLSFGFTAPAAVAVSLLDRVISFWMMTAAGAVCVVAEREFLK